MSVDRLVNIEEIENAVMSVSGYFPHRSRTLL